MRKISIITPCYNEENSIRECYAAVKDLFRDLKGYDYEHIFADNASTDNTLKYLKDLAAADRRVKVIVNSRNFGPLRSCFNALLSCSGDAAVVMLAADLQDPPELIPEFIKRWETGYEIVYGIRKKREGSASLSLVKKFYYRLVNRTSLVDLPPDTGEFQFIDRVVIEALRKYDDYYPYLRGMIASCGFKSIGVEYLWQVRRKGESKSNLYHLVDLALNGLISFSNLPLRICILIGFLLAAGSIIYALSQLILNIIFYHQLVNPGMASLLVGIFFFTGVQLFFLGVIGEYISAIHFQVKRRPLVIERERINFNIPDRTNSSSPETGEGQR